MDGLPRIGQLDGAQARTVRRDTNRRSQKRFDPAMRGGATEEEPPDREEANARAFGYRDEDEAGGKIDVTA